MKDLLTFTLSFTTEDTMFVTVVRGIVGFFCSFSLLIVLSMKFHNANKNWREK